LLYFLGERGGATGGRKGIKVQLIFSNRFEERDIEKYFFRSKLDIPSEALSPL
jgi:hypothetical protein